MTICFILLIVMTFLGAVASLHLKKAAGGSILEIIKNINLYIGGFLYASAAVMNIIVLKYLDYSIVLPLTSITYIWTMVLSYAILKEKITKKKICGVVFIIIGAALVSV